MRSASSHSCGMPANTSCLSFSTLPSASRPSSPGYWFTTLEASPFLIEIKAFLENAFPEPRTIQNEIELIQNALEAFDRCRQNRNQFTHFTLEHDLEARTVHLRRQQKGPLISRVPFPTELSDMRRVAGEIIGMNNMLNSITTYIKNHGTDQAVPLPDTVAPPELLSSPAPQAHKEPQPQRPPSVLRLTEEEWIAKCRKERRTLRDGLEAG